MLKGVRTPVRNVLESVGVSAVCLGLWRYGAPVQQCVAKKMCACHHNRGGPTSPLRAHS